MNVQALLKTYDNGQLSRDGITDILGRTCTTYYLAGAYIKTRMQRDECREQAHANGAEPPKQHLPNTVVMDLIGYAYIANDIDRASAYTMLAAIGYGGDIAETYLEELLDAKFPLAVRETYLADPENAMLFCTRCGIKVDANLLSTNSLCIECSSAAAEQNLIELDTKEGPYYRHWRDTMLAYAFNLANETLDDIEPRKPPTKGDMLDYVPCTNYPDDDADNNDSTWFCSFCSAIVMQGSNCKCGSTHPYDPPNTELPHQDEVPF